MTDLSILNNQSIVFIGGGNMASALIDGLLNAKHTYHLSFDIAVSDTNDSKRQAFTAKGVTAVAPEAIRPLLDKATIIVLAVKPQVLAEVCQSLLPLPDALIVSVAAGISVEALCTMTGKTRIARTMPNLPATIGLGATGLFAQALDDADRAKTSAIMSASGIAIWVNKEADLHTVTAVAGSAPAYFFYMLEHMIDKAVAMGLDKDTAKALATQTMQGAALMAKQDDPSELRAKVTSKGGTTHAAITYLQSHEVGERLGEAMQACSARSMELGR